MLRRPIFRTHLRVEVLEGEGVLLRSEHTAAVLDGAMVERLAPLLDGRHGTEEIVERLAERWPPAEVYYLLLELEARGYLAEAQDSLPAPEAAFWHALGADAVLASARVAQTGLAVVSPVPGWGERASADLSALGFRLSSPAGLTLALVDDYLDPVLEEINGGALAESRPWLLAKPAGTVPWIGPLFRPGSTACWSCLAQRLRRNRPVEQFLRARRGATPPAAAPAPLLPAVWQAALGLLAARLAVLLGTGTDEGLTDGLLSLDLRSGTVSRHAVTRRPQCAACGDPGLFARGVRRPIEILPREAADGAALGLRSLPAAELLRRSEHLVSPITGVVPWLTRLSSPADEPLHVYAGGPNSPRGAGSLASARRDLRSHNAGKGFTDAHARASALAEAVERYSRHLQGDEPRVRASLRELGESAIHPNRCMLFSEEQFRRRGEGNGRGAPATRVPLPLPPDAPLDWTPLWSLSRAEPRYLPTDLLFYGGPASPVEPEHCCADSNGAAAGASLEEAILQGLLELVERDAVSIWWYNRIRRPAVDLAALPDARAQALIRRHRSAGREVWALDLTTDLGIPTYAALSRRSDGPEGVRIGFGAHLSPRTAVLRALAEMGQMEVGLRAAGRPARAGDEGPDHLAAFAGAAQPHLFPAPGGLRPLPAAADSAPDLAEALRLCLRRVEDGGHEVLAIDQTRPDIGIAVAKVVVPGLRHLSPRFAPGRLYEVPVSQGWLDRPLAERDLNPLPIVF